jgi:dienelactone hydrolase
MFEKQTSETDSQNQEIGRFMKRLIEPMRLSIPVREHLIHGDLALPHNASGAVIFAHGSGSGRHSPRNQYVAEVLQQAGLATLLVDLLTTHEEQIDQQTLEYRFNIGLLAERLVGATDWLREDRNFSHLRIGYFGASTGAAAALIAAALRPNVIDAVVSRGGRPDLGGGALLRVIAPTLFIVGELDHEVLLLNQQAAASMPVSPIIEIVPGATHLFEESGSLEQVSFLARDWFRKNLTRSNAA